MLALNPAFLDLLGKHADGTAVILDLALHLRLIGWMDLRAPHKAPERRQFSLWPHRRQRAFCERL